MILQILERFSRIIKSFEIQKFRINDSSYEIALTIIFRDKSIIFIRDYLFSDNERKYSYHWQNAKDECLYRWDNSPHHQRTQTFPCHVHIGKSETVADSQSMSLEQVLTFIEAKLG